jgi:hypothetical protein
LSLAHGLKLRWIGSGHRPQALTGRVDMDVIQAALYAIECLPGDLRGRRLLSSDDSRHVRVDKAGVHAYDMGVL